MNWSYDIEQQIRNFLLKENPDFKDKLNKGFHWLQMPSTLSRFYMRDTAAYLRDRRGMNVKVLDFGCGTGTSTLYYWSQGLTNIEAMDHDLYLVEVANKVFSFFGAPIRAVGVDSNDVYALRGRWDVVLMQDFLYFGFDVPRVLRSLRNVLPVGGLFIFDLMDSDVPVHQYRTYHSQEEIEDMLRDAGYLLALKSTLNERGCVKTMYVAELREAESPLSPGGMPWV